MAQLYLSDNNQNLLDELFNESEINNKTDFVTELLKTYKNNANVETEPELETINTVMNPIGVGSDNDIDILLNDENIMKMSDLNANTISTISVAKMYADKYQSDSLKQYINNYLKFSVSKSRKGRGELVDSFKASILEPLGLGLENLMGDNDDK